MGTDLALLGLPDGQAAPGVLSPHSRPIPAKAVPESTGTFLILASMVDLFAYVAIATVPYR